MITLSLRNQILIIRAAALTMMAVQGAVFVHTKWLVKEYNRRTKMLTYLVHLCQEHNVPLTEFDVIVLTEMGMITEVSDAAE